MQGVGFGARSSTSVKGLGLRVRGCLQSSVRLGLPGWVAQILSTFSLCFVPQVPHVCMQKSAGGQFNSKHHVGLHCDP